jgi:hypothetical protein
VADVRGREHMKTRLMRSIFLLLALATFGLLGAGCYTVLVHPMVESTGDSETQRTCSDCHASADYYYWHFPHQYDWYSRHSSWSRYYYDPWWWDNYWYWRDDHGRGGGSGAPQGHLWQPRVAPTAEPTLAPSTGGNPSDANKSKDKGSGSDTDKESSKEKQQLWQPRVPPKNTDDKTSDDAGQTDRGDDQQQEKAEGN